MATPKILVVDDLHQNLQALEQQISDLGAEVVCVDSGEAALEVLLRESFALILLDIQMPNMDGFELAETIRLSPKHRSTPLIFLTAIDADDIYIFKGYEKGAVDFIQKPIKAEILRSKVNVFIEIARKNSLIAASEMKHRLLVEGHGMSKFCQTCGNYNAVGDGGCMRPRAYANGDKSEPPSFGFPIEYEVDPATWRGTLARVIGDVCGIEKNHWTPKKEFKQ